VGISNARPVWFTVTFADSFPADLLDGMFNTNFVGLGEIYRQDNPRILVLKPFRNSYGVALETLEELQSHGALTFVQHFR
jgi:hypothetical protein